jgi:uncharacterized membrane-anchored protein YhcB (DUF1043 family)
MRNKPEVQNELKIEALKNDIARLEGIVYQEIANTQDLVRQLHTDMWNMVQHINASQAESVGLSVVSRLSSEMEKVRGQLGDFRQEFIAELRRQ